MIGKTNASLGYGGGGNSGSYVAILNVYYPSGSTCQISQGSKIIKAPTTGGVASFGVPSTGEWTVTVSDGSRSKSTTATVEEEGEIVTVALSFTRILLDTSVPEFDSEVQLYNSGFATPTFNAAEGTVSTSKGNSNSSARIMWYIGMDLTTFNSITSKQFSRSASNSGGYNGLWVLEKTTSLSQNTNGRPSGTIVVSSERSRGGATNPGTSYTEDYSVDVSELTGEYWVAIGLGHDNTNSQNTNRSAAYTIYSWYCE